MREISLNGYIDDEVWFGDEITPEALHESLYGAKNENSDDVHIRLNSYGGSCNAATRMFDDIRAYPGNVHITVSGTAASAATVLSMAADRLEMTPGSLWMIHDPSTIAWGDERDFSEAIQLLKACKESILNMYSRRCRWNRIDISTLMTATTWMDAQAALSYGFIDAIADESKSGFLQNADKTHMLDRVEAERKVQAWLDRHKPHKPQLLRPVKDEAETSEASSQPDDICPAVEPPTTDVEVLPGDDRTSTVQPDDEQAIRPEQGDVTAQAPQSEEPSDSVEPERTELDVAVDSPPKPPDKPDTTEQPEAPGIPVAQLHKRLGLIMPAKRSY